jgi:hypothetical protein
MAHRTGRGSVHPALVHNSHTTTPPNLQLLTFAEWASMDEESRARADERRRLVFQATEWGMSSIDAALRLLAVRSAASAVN